jgi:hypothetical protein
VGQSGSKGYSWEILTQSGIFPKPVMEEVIILFNL